MKHTVTLDCEQIEGLVASSLKEARLLEDELTDLEKAAFEIVIECFSTPTDFADFKDLL